MDQEVIIIRQTHPPEAAGSTPATRPGSRFRDRGRRQARTPATKGRRDPRGRAVECEDGEVEIGVGGLEV